MRNWIIHIYIYIPTLLRWVSSGVPLKSTTLTLRFLIYTYLRSSLRPDRTVLSRFPKDWTGLWSQLTGPYGPVSIYGLHFQAWDRTVASLTPTTQNQSRWLYCVITPGKLQIIKLCNAAENAFADRSLLLDKNQLLFEQNCECNVVKSIQLRIIGTAKVLSYKDLCEAEKQQDLKNITTQAISRPSHNPKLLQWNSRKRSCSEDLIEAADQISSIGLREYCTVFSCN